MVATASTVYCDSASTSSNEEDTKRRVLAAVTVASKCDYAISLEEVSHLMPEGAAFEPQNLKRIIAEDERFTLRGKLAVLRGREHLLGYRSMRHRASENSMKLASAFVGDLARRCPYLKLAAVSGSVAYKNAKELDDIDIFLVTEPGRLWLAIFNALLLARIYNIKGYMARRPINFCLSYAVDSGRCEKEFARRRTPLFAREVLSIRTLLGFNYYASLVVRNHWIAKRFPRLFKARLGNTPNQPDEDPSPPHSLLGGFINLFLCMVLSRFLALKGLIRNIKYLKAGRTEDLFEVITAEDACMYNSRRYSEINMLHRPLGEAT